MVDFGTPFEIRWGQTWHQNQPSGAANLKKSRRVSSKTTLLGRPCSPKPARSAHPHSNRSKNQELANIFRILDSEIALSQFAALQKRQQLQQTHAPKRRATNWGAAVLAPHGAFGSAAPGLPGHERAESRA